MNSNFGPVFEFAQALSDLRDSGGTLNQSAL